jgi:hypothetical protein
MAEQQQALAVQGQATGMALAAQVIPQEVALFEMQQRQARLMVATGLFSDIKGESQEQSIAKAFFKIALGASMGFSAAESMQGIDIIQGRPAIGAHLRAARTEAHGITWPQMVISDKGCWMPLCMHGRPMLQPKIDPATNAIAMGKDGLPVMVQTVVAFTMEDAMRMGLAGKDNWKKQPQDMLFARCVTRVQRRYAPNALGSSGGRVLDLTEAQDGVYEHVPTELPPVPEVQAPPSNALTPEQAKRLMQAWAGKGDKGVELLTQALGNLGYENIGQVQQKDLEGLLALAVE